jgi:chemotaxis protein MotB
MRKSRLAAAALLVATACVSSGKFEKKEAEADALHWSLRLEREKSSDLAAKLESLSAQLASLQGEKDQVDQKALRLAAAIDQREVALRQAAAKEGQLRASLADLSESKSRLEATAAELEAKNQELVAKSAESGQLAESLKGEIDQGKIELAEAKGKMTVKLKDKILFASGSASLGAEGKAALAKVAAAFKEMKGKIVRVEGHTDDRPIGSAAFPSNWELSGARALAVVRFLQERGVDPAVLAGAAYSQYRPISGNDTPEGRSQNRRIEIVLAPAET